MKTKISVTTINGCRGLPAIAAVQITKVIKTRLAGLENIIFMDGEPSTVCLKHVNEILYPTFQNCGLNDFKVQLPNLTCVGVFTGNYVLI